MTNGLVLVRTAHGLWVHLGVPGEAVPERALCGFRVTALELTTWFALAGCRRCILRALKLGHTHVVDVDGEVLPLDSLEPLV